jgi:hypothetical protein
MVFDAIRMPFPQLWTMSECLRLLRSFFPMALVCVIFVLDNTLDRQKPLEVGLQNLKMVVEKQKATMQEATKYFYELKKGEPSLERD